ncbi:MAG: 50S ribosomal protein L25 [Verrucomicrobiota bacterium]
MAKQVKLQAQVRPGVGRSAVNKIKQQGLVPAVIYGGKGEPQALQVSAREIRNLLSHAVGENILVDLEIDNAGTVTSSMALIQEVQHNPLGGAVLHVDFRAVSRDQAITAEIPVEPVGEPNGVRNFGGLLEQNLRTLEIECLPQDLPEIITVDVTALNIGDAIHIKDIKLPDGVSATQDPDLTVFIMAAPTVEEAPAAEAVAATTPEVIKQKKEEPAAEAKGGDKK